MKNKKITIRTSGKKNGVISVIKLFNKYFFKSFFGPFFTFAFPVMLLGILGSLMNPNQITVGIIAMSAASMGLMSLPVAILSLKESVLLKRIGASTVSEKEFTFAIISYFIALGFISVAWIFMWAQIMFGAKKGFSFGHIEWGGFVLGYLFNLMVSLSLGMLVSSRSKTQQQAQAIGMLIYFPSSFLSGMFIEIDIITSNKIMNIISYMLPFRYTTGLMVTSWAGNDGSLIPHARSIFDFANSVFIYGIKGKVEIYNQVDMILNLALPPLFTILTTGLAIKWFKWTRR